MERNQEKERLYCKSKYSSWKLCRILYALISYIDRKSLISHELKDNFRSWNFHLPFMNCKINRFMKRRCLIY